MVRESYLMKICEIGMKDCCEKVVKVLITEFLKGCENML